ncbi:hypothetical protein C7974DRAFT_476160 [Boeremia exigua]|uniref:uncharacterized protein n=1 Tax=Boeremia exigua TaxID=749465 RepID=UPI001E8DD39F|nr:uncharacterized protein C7974DRAFT_476160 [Boeremia exigua]KAH6613062.1 hypothetical protein C7974DRAFT_476160 [Boeremia exigua]
MARARPSERHATGTLRAQGPQRRGGRLAAGLGGWWTGRPRWKCRRLSWGDHAERAAAMPAADVFVVVLAEHVNTRRRGEAKGPPAKNPAQPDRDFFHSVSVADVRAGEQIANAAGRTVVDVCSRTATPRRARSTLARHSDSGFVLLDAVVKQMKSDMQRRFADAACQASSRSHRVRGLCVIMERAAQRVCDEACRVTIETRADGVWRAQQRWQQREAAYDMAGNGAAWPATVRPATHSRRSIDMALQSQRAGSWASVEGPGRGAGHGGL